MSGYGRFKGKDFKNLDDFRDMFLKKKLDNQHKPLSLIIQERLDKAQAITSAAASAVAAASSSSSSLSFAANVPNLNSNSIVIANEPREIRKKRNGGPSRNGDWKVFIPPDDGGKHVSFSKKRKYLHYLEDEEEFEQSEMIQQHQNTLDIPFELDNDTICAIRILAGRFCSPIVFVHQLYTIISDKTQVNQEIKASKSKLRLFSVPILGSGTHIVCLLEDVLALCDSFINTIEEEENKNLVRLFKDKVLSVHEDPLIHFNTLRALLDPSAEKGDKFKTQRDINELISLGFLRSSDHIADASDMVYMFFLPGLGSIISQTIDARKDIIRKLKLKRNFKFGNRKGEVLISELKQKHWPQFLEYDSSSTTQVENSAGENEYVAKEKKKKRSIMGTDFHISDIIGADIVNTFDTPEGPNTLIRLPLISRT